jgi:hypothetical protein
MTEGVARKGRAWRRALLASGLVALVLSACAKKVTTVDPGFTPEGAASLQNGLAVWREIPNPIYVYHRGQPDANPPVPNTLLDSVYVPTPVPGQIHGVIRDSTVADGYQVYRREANGGARQLFDFDATPTKRWVDRGWEIFHFTDPDSVVPTHTYLGRGLVGGRATVGSPLTNEASDVVRSVQNVHYTGLVGGNDSGGNPIPVDSLFTMEWEAVPGASAYYIHVYQWAFNLTRVEDQVASGAPAPLFIGRSHDILVAYMPSPDPLALPPTRFSLKMPQPNERPPQARVMTCRLTRFGQDYLVRIAAVDALGQLIAYTYGSDSQELTTLPDGTALTGGDFATFRIGAVKVTPTRARTSALLRARRIGTQRP